MKIILLGLSQAGKTSIQDVFFGGKKPEETQDYAATLNYERRIEAAAEEPVTLMDLGGQDVFLKRFLNELSSFVFSNVSVLVFVCDIAASEKFLASKKAFAEGVACLEEMSKQRPRIYVLLHKTDLISDPTKKTETMGFLMEMFQDAVSAKNITFCQTSIYNKTIHEVFKRIMAEVGEPIPQLEETKEEDQLNIISQQLQRRPIQQSLCTFQLLNRLDEVLLVSLDDPEFLVSCSTTDVNDVKPLLRLLEKASYLRLACDIDSNIERLDSMIAYRSRVEPHHLLLVFSSDAKAMLQTKNLSEIEDQVQLLSNQLTEMLHSLA
jgi:GTPase SAR1 family protein